MTKTKSHKGTSRNINTYNTCLDPSTNTFIKTNQLLSTIKDPLYIKTNLDISNAKNNYPFNSTRAIKIHEKPKAILRMPLKLLKDVDNRENYKTIVKKEMELIRAIGPKAARIVREAKMLSKTRNNLVFNSVSHLKDKGVELIKRETVVTECTSGRCVEKVFKFPETITEIKKLPF